MPPQVFASGQWTYTESMNSLHNNSPMVLLQDGRVAMIGGNDIVVETYNESTGQWVQAGSVSFSRDAYNPVVLNNGKVLLAGGNTNGSFNPQVSAELFDPSVGQAFSTGTLNVARSCASLIALQDGRVLAISGATHGFNPLYTTELYEPEAGTWSYTGDVVSPIFDCEGGAASVLLDDGRVLVAGGFSGTNSSITQLYNPITGQWTHAGSLQVARSLTKLIKLQDGRVLMIGGDQAGSGSLAECEIYNPSTDSWTQTGSLNNSQRVSHAVLLPDGRVFIAGGQASNGGAVLASEIYDPATGQWSLDAPTNEGHILGALAMLTNGKILLAGGRSGEEGHPQTKTAELYTIDAITKKDMFNAVAKFNSPLGSSTLYPNAMGQVKFEVHAKYKGTTPTGFVRMNFSAAKLDFAATSLTSLTIENGKATLRGKGTINGSGNYNVQVTGVQKFGENGLIRFRITDFLNSNALVYDSQPGESNDAADPTTPVTGTIVVH